MTEKINGQGFRPTDMTGSTRRPEASEAGASAGSSGTSATTAGDTVNLTRSGVLLSQLEEAISLINIVDVERVDAVKSAIASGTYEVNSHVVAEKMILLDRELS